MTRCAGCNTELYALNISDSLIGYCQDCEQARKEASRINDRETTLVLWQGEMVRR